MTTATEPKRRTGRRAWAHQLKRQIDAMGADHAPWCVDWSDPEGKRHRQSCGPGTKGKRSADKLADRLHSELVTGTYQAGTRKTWGAFVAAYKEKFSPRLGPATRKQSLIALAHYERLMKPAKMTAIDSAKIDAYITKRLAEATGKGSKVAVATVNKELRHLRAALRIAEDWKYLAKTPKFRFLKQSEKLPTFVPPEHFAAIYAACQTATYPNDLPNIAAADWWQALVVVAYMTGWRIGQILSLKWQDVDLEAATALSRAEDTKGKREERIPLHPLIVEHLGQLKGSFDSHVFPWNRRERALWFAFKDIQAASKLVDGTAMPKQGKPNRDGSDGWYGFHDLRRGFATLNAAGMDLFQLQALMQHRSLDTTRRYVNMATRLNKAVDGLFVPNVTRAAQASG
ncbi:MAG: tyrosine-type recombinase/integrase [Planctomycetaceae bacterium]|nr:tyrosine-type recombinase/integrase [Planctomycetaceae bacterium]